MMILMQNANWVLTYMFTFFARHKNANLLKILPGKRIGGIIHNNVQYCCLLHLLLLCIVIYNSPNSFT